MYIMTQLYTNTIGVQLSTSETRDGNEGAIQFIEAPANRNHTNRMHAGTV